MKKYYILTIFILIFVSVSFSQRKMRDLPQCRYDFFQLSVSGGFIQPVGYMYELYNPSGNFGVISLTRLIKKLRLIWKAVLTLWGCRILLVPALIILNSL